MTGHAGKFVFCNSNVEDLLLVLLGDGPSREEATDDDQAESKQHGDRCSRHHPLHCQPVRPELETLWRTEHPPASKAVAPIAIVRFYQIGNTVTKLTIPDLNGKIFLVTGASTGHWRGGRYRPGRPRRFGRGPLQCQRRRGPAGRGNHRERRRLRVPRRRRCDQLRQSVVRSCRRQRNTSAGSTD